MSLPEPSGGPLVIRDGANHPYEVVGYQATFTLRSTENGHVVTVGSETLRTLGVEWNGRTLKEIGR